MKRVAALYDIHGNIAALEAVLHELEHAGAELIVVGGDVFPGPLALETLALLRSLELPVQFIRGNGESAVLACLAGDDLDALPERARQAVRHAAARVDSALREILAGWPATLRLSIAGAGEVLFCHATPRRDTEIFTRVTPEERLVPMFEGADAELVVCGHTHMPFDRRVGTMRVVNAGSIGMPFGKPGADWLLLGPGVEPRHTTYDFSAAAERIRSSADPTSEEFARSVMQPPAEEDMLRLYEGSRPQ